MNSVDGLEPTEHHRESRRASKAPSKNRKLWDLEWKDINYQIPVKEKKHRFKKSETSFKTVLVDSTGRVKHGEAIAILGPSGAGKSTLLNVLAGRLSVGIPTGTITINGQKRNKSWKRIAAYVEQADVMYSSLTVRETVTFAALLKLPHSMDEEEKKHRVQSTIEMLGLKSVAESRIGNAENRGISGGEKKRVSIAIELVSDPGLMFLDEPTSGLDAFTAQTVVDKITQLAQVEGRTVLLTIHQPRLNILRQFNKIILLSKGNVVFFGSVDDAIDHFQRLGYQCPQLENPADFFLDLITIDQRSEALKLKSTERVDKFIDGWKNHQELGFIEAGNAIDQNLNEKNECDEQYDHQANICTEFHLLLQRYFRIQTREYTTIIGVVAQTIIIALLLSFVFFQLGDSNFGAIQSRVGLLFFIATNQMFVILVPLIDSFTKDREIILRERYSGTYRIFSAYSAKFISVLPLQFVLTTIFSFMVYYIAGLRTDGFQYFLIFYGFNLLLALSAICLGLLVAASVPSNEIGQIVGPLVVVIFLIFGGTLANVDQITWILRWIQYLSPLFYTYQALIQNELTGRDFNGTTGEEYLELYSANVVSELWSMGAMLILSFSFLAFGYVAIRITTRPKTVII